MADFVAVIRRAVDGLSNNTPEMRAKVYDKARSAVTRQLENMSPRPPEETLRRQLLKLDVAIEEVELEHAEALPGDDQSFAAEVAAHEAYLLPDQAEAEEPAEVEAPPSGHEPAAYKAPAAYEPEAAEPEPAYEEREAYEPSVYVPTAPDAADIDAAFAETDHQEPRFPADPVEQPLSSDAAWDDAHFAEPTPPPAADPEPSISEPQHEAESADGGGWNVEAPETSVEVRDWAAVAPSAPPAEDDWEVEVDRSNGGPAGVTADAAAPEVFWQPTAAAAVEPDSSASAEEPPRSRRPSWPDAPALEPVMGRAEPDAEEVHSFEPWLSPDAPVISDTGEDADRAMVSTYGNARARDELDDFLDGVQGSQQATEMPAIDLLQWDNFQPATQPVPAAQPRAAAAIAEESPNDWFARTPIAAASTNGNALDELEALLDQNRPADAADNVAASPRDGDIEDFLASSENTAYRVETKPRRNYAPLVLALAGVVILAGGGYAAWSNRTLIEEFVADMTASSSTPADAVSPTSATDVATAPATTQTESTPSTTTPVESTPAATNGAAAVPDGSVTGQKFTQRLMADGSEVDQGVGGAGDGTEGKSVAEQNAGAASQPAVQSGAGAGAAATPTAAAVPDSALPVGSQKAFLYEERLGQSAPTAIAGNIVWTALTEPGETARPEPVIQGKLTVPGVGITALITFKRNTDNSLPASHLAEIVFSLPANFEGGAIETVERMAMKRTEQDRGDALVAVSAKVTDDTFLIAFNDFQDVIAHNIDLLRTRNWIDIPVTYRNGRRALLTLDKGVDGAKVFDTVIREWAAQGPAKSGG